MRYRCLRHISHGTTPTNAKVYSPGEVIDLADKYAKPLLDVGAIETEFKPVKLQVRSIFTRKPSNG